MKLKRASYRYGVEWIAMNDNAGNNDTIEEVEGYITVGMLADLFGTTMARVAADVMQCRQNEP